MNLQQLTKFSLSLMLMLCLATVTFAQEGLKAVSGTIRDADGNPIEGVTVSVKGRSGSVLTDAKGNYTIPVAPGQNLTFTHIAFTTKEVKAGTDGSINVSLEKSNTSLDDVIVVGYGTQKKIHLTGSVETIKSREIEDLPVSNLGAALAGRVLGLSVSGGNARPGSKAVLKLRNPETYSKDAGGVFPLFVIDGIIQVGPDGKNDATQFDALDASEIETISFLKDAAAAIYGSRAANGVVIVTTKRGKVGAPRISYSGSYAVMDETYRTKMMSAYDFGRYMNIMNGPNGFNKTAKEYIFSEDELEHMKTINYDWLEPVWSSSNNMRHTLNVSGGSERATYYAGASYFTQSGNLSTNDFKKWTFRAGADINVAAGLKTGLQVSGNFSDLTRTFNKVNSEDENDDYRNLLVAPRYIPTYVDGYPVKLPGSNKLAAYHFYEIQKLNNLAITKTKTLAINAYAEYETPFVKGLKARVNYSRYFNGTTGSQLGTKYLLYNFTMKGDNEHIYDGATVKLPGTTYTNGNRLYYGNNNGEMEQVNFTVSYGRQFGAHNISALASVERGEAYNQQADVWKENPVQTTNGQFGSAFGIIDGKTLANESGTLGYIGRLNYNYSSKYLLEFLYRTDASTHFAPENYFGNFYSVSAGWIVTSEKFFDVPAINFLKIRASAGQLGKDDTKAWQWRQRYTYQNGKGAVFGGNNQTTTGMKMEAAPNRNAQWSKEFKYNLGIDAKFMNNRLSAGIDGFYNKGTMMLMERNAAVPITVGGNLAAENWGIQHFYGYEVSVGWNDNVGRDFSYGIDVRFTWFDNKWKQGSFNAIESLKPWNTGEGKSGDVGAWGHDVLGMFKTQEEIDAYVKEYNITTVFERPITDLKPGQLYYRDVRGQMSPDGTFAGPDGIIDENDQILLAKKESNPYNIGSTIRLGYKGFNFEAVISGSFGGWSEIDGTTRDNLDPQIANNFQSRPSIWNNIYDPVLNPTGNMPNPYWQAISLDPRSNFWKVSAFRMAVRSANLSYALPKTVTSMLRITNARVVVSMLNPVNLYNPFSYRSPDNSYDVFPTLRTFSFGLNCTL